MELSINYLSLLIFRRKTNSLRGKFFIIKRDSEIVVKQFKKTPNSKIFTDLKINPNLNKLDN